MKFPGCCPMAGKAGLFFLGAAMMAGFGAAGYLAGRSESRPVQQWSIPGVQLDATATDSGEEFAIATGHVSDECEGLFVLDYATGLLQCHVLYTRAQPPQFGGIFQANVKEILPGDVAKGVSKYLMVTGHAEFPGSAQRSAATVVYVLDTVTGAFVCYGVPFNRTAVNAGTPQAMALIPIANGQARGLPDRNRR